MISHEDAILEPLTTDALIEKRVADLIGRANQRQLWVLFLDEFDVQSPVLIPIEGLPDAPSGVGPGIALRLAAEEVGATSIVLVWERYASAALSSSDREWIRAVTESCSEADVRVRAVLLSHREGVRWVAPDDWAFRPPTDSGS
jgi:hypothetical protein